MKVQTIMQQIAGGVFMGKVITIAREFGSGGRIIAQNLAEQLKIGFYDKNLITLAAERKNLPEERLERVDERRENPWRYDMEDDIAIQRQFYYEPLNDVLFEAQSEIIKEKAETEDCSAFNVTENVESSFIVGTRSSGFHVTANALVSVSIPANREM